MVPITKVLAYEVVTPTGRISSGECDMVVAPAVEGEIGILPRHAPYLAALAVGVVRIKKGDSEERIFVSNGYIEVLENKAIILAEVAEKSGDIDVERAQRSLERAQSHIAGSPAGHDRNRAMRALSRAKARIKAAKGR